MKFYAVVDGIRILRVVESEYPTEDGSVELVGWNGVPEGQGPGMSLCVHEGVAVWMDLRLLEDAKTIKWEEVKQSRTAEIDSPLATPFGIFAANPASRTDIVDAVFLARTLHQLGLPSDTDFTLLDNSTVTLDVNQMTQVGLLLGARIQAAFAKGRVLRAQVDAATSLEEVDAVSW